MPWRDLAALLDDAAEQAAQEFRDSENLAMLVDRFDFYLGGEYVDRITDPNDPAVKAAAERRRRLRITPPPVPILTPIALRRPDVHDLRRTQADTARAEFATPKTKSDPAQVGGRERVDAAGWRELEAAHARAAAAN